MKIIYVAGKYTAKTRNDIAENIKKAEDASVSLLKQGWGVFTPHKNTSHYEQYEDEDLTYETWIELGLEMLSRCDAIFMLRNWKDSKGACRERELAASLEMPIFYEEDGYPNSDAEIIPPLSVSRG